MSNKSDLISCDISTQWDCTLSPCKRYVYEKTVEYTQKNDKKNICCIMVVAFRMESFCCCFQFPLVL